MKAVYHKQDESYRYVQRGKRYFVQHSDGSQSTREAQPWNDIGKPCESAVQASAVMYGLKPEVRT